MGRKKWQGIIIERGSFVCTFRDFAKEIGVSVRNLRTAFDKLESTGEIEKKTNSLFTKIVVRKYEYYQGGKKSDTQSDTLCDTQSDTGNIVVNNYNTKKYNDVILKSDTLCDTQTTHTKEYNSINNTSVCIYNARACEEESQADIFKSYEERISKVLKKILEDENTMIYAKQHRIEKEIVLQIVLEFQEEEKMVRQFSTIIQDDYLLVQVRKYIYGIIRNKATKPSAQSIHEKPKSLLQRVADTRKQIRQ